MTGVYLHLFHGRKDPHEDMDDWGFDGPTIGPLEYVHVTYGDDVKFACSWETAKTFFKAKADAWSSAYPDMLKYSFESHIPTYEGCIIYDGDYYGDWSVFGPEQLPEIPLFMYLGADAHYAP